MGKEKKINTNNFKIENNVISFDDVLLQISNISYINIEKPPKKQVNVFFIIVLIIGVLLATSSDKTLIVAGIVFIMAASIYISWFLLFSDNFNDEKRYLYICLNSGNGYYIVCENQKFLKKVLRVITHCINHHSDQNVRIDFDNCKVYNSPIIVGNENEVN